MFILDMFMNLSGGGGNGRKSVRMLPKLHRPFFLRVGEAIFGHMTVDGSPMQRNWAQPQREFANRAFAQWLEFVHTNDHGRRCQLFEDACVVVEGGNGR